MPRKPTIQPAPLDSFELDDGTIVEIRNHQTREIGRGKDKEFESEELDWQVLLGLVDDLNSSNDFNVTRATTALRSNKAMGRFLLDAGYEMDERTACRHGKSIRAKYNQTMVIVDNVNNQNLT